MQIFCVHMCFGCTIYIHSSNVWLPSFVANGEWHVVSSKWGVLENTQAWFSVFSTLYHNMEVEHLIDMLDYLVYWLFGNIVSILTKLPVHDSVCRQATLPKTIRPRTKMTTKTTNKLNLAWRQIAMIRRHVIIEVVGSIYTLCIVVESSLLLFSVQKKTPHFYEQSR